MSWFRSGESGVVGEQQAFWFGIDGFIFFPAFQNGACFLFGVGVTT